MQWLARHRRITLAAICIFWTGLIFLGVVLPKVPFLSSPWTFQQSFEDVLRRQGRKTPERTDFVFVGVDQASLQISQAHNAIFGPEEIAGNRPLELMAERPFPWSREIWALFLDKMFAAGARLVMFDMIFDSANNGDPAFGAALDKYRDRVVIGENFDIARNKTLVLPNTDLIAEPQLQDDRVGYVNFWPDYTDNRVRAAIFHLSQRQLYGQNPVSQDEVFTSFAARALTKLGHGKDVPSDYRTHAIRFGPPDAYEPIELWRIFDPKSWQTNLHGGADFKDKIIVVGASSQIMHDVVDTPLGPSTYGPALHLHTMAAALAHEYLSSSPPILAVALVGLGGLAAFALITFVRRPVLSFTGLLATVLLYLIVVRLLYDGRGFFLITIPVLSAFTLSGVSSLGFDYALERLEKLRTRRTLERYVSKNLVKEILENPDSYYHSLRGTRVPATMLFSDLIGFTTLSEKADPEELVRHLNEYLTKMTAVIFENGGTLDKFIGDAIMAVWGNVHSYGVAEDAKKAVRAAHGMRTALRKLNDAWRSQGRMGLGMGVGVNQGEVIVGNVGSQERMDPTVIGDAVNLASRLEGLTRIYGVDILIGSSVAELVRDEFHLRSVARVQVKGKTQPVDVLTLLGPRNNSLDPQLLKWVETYEEGLIKFRERDFKQSKILFSQFLEFYPEDNLAKMYLDRALEYEQQPPDDAWNAVEVFKKK
ncbi:MAG TPA: adenylate/guanylate cyclase domain-containing protein [Chthoniobacterales bacterium]|jgi:adenylate cyclase